MQTRGMVRRTMFSRARPQPNREGRDPSLRQRVNATAACMSFTCTIRWIAAAQYLL